LQLGGSLIETFITPAPGDVVSELFPPPQLTTIPATGKTPLTSNTAARISRVPKLRKPFMCFSFGLQEAGFFHEKRFEQSPGINAL
jgi:hypothetical protein